MDAIRSKLQEIEAQYNDINAKLMDEEVLKDPSVVARLSKEQARLEQSVDAWRKLQDLDTRIEEAQTLLGEDDAELKEMAEAEHLLCFACSPEVDFCVI